MTVKKKDDLTVVEGITIEDDEEDVKNEQNTLQDTLKEIGKQLFATHPRKKSKLSRNNVIGLIQAEVLNDYMDTNFGYRYGVLDTLINCARDYPISESGFGIEKYIEGIKSIQASFEQTELPSKLKGLLR